jgi:hypothetical protein
VEQLRGAALVGAAEAAAAAAAAAAVEVAARVTCVVCYDAFNPALGVTCTEGHFLCSHHGEGDDCLGGHVRARVEALQQTERLAAQAGAYTRPHFSPT